VGIIVKKPSEGVCFVDSALKIQCYIVKNTLLRTAFLILPTGWWLLCMHSKMIVEFYLVDIVD